MDRAHRIGQTRVVNVYRLITQGTLEERIMSLQQFKINTANSVINEDNSSLGKMDTSKMLDLFEHSARSEINRVQEESVQEESLPGNMPLEGDANIPKALQGLQQLWNDKEQYKEYNLDAFISKMKGNK